MLVLKLGFFFPLLKNQNFPKFLFSSPELSPSHPFSVICKSSLVVVVIVCSFLFPLFPLQIQSLVTSSQLGVNKAEFSPLALPKWAPCRRWWFSLVVGDLMVKKISPCMGFPSQKKKCIFKDVFFCLGVGGWEQ